MIKKYSSPTKFDPAPCGTLWIVEDDKKDLRLYIQTSPDESQPVWMTIGDFIEKQIISGIKLEK